MNNQPIMDFQINQRLTTQNNSGKGCENNQNNDNTIGKLKRRSSKRIKNVKNMIHLHYHLIKYIYIGYYNPKWTILYCNV